MGVIVKVLPGKFTVSESFALQKSQLDSFNDIRKNIERHTAHTMVSWHNLN